MSMDSPTRIDSYPTVRTPLPSPPLDDRLTIDLREPIDPNATVEHHVIDLRETARLPHRAGPPAPAQQRVEVVRFAPAVPAVLEAEAAVAAEPSAVPGRSRRERVLNM